MLAVLSILAIAISYLLEMAVLLVRAFLATGEASSTGSREDERQMNGPLRRVSDAPLY
ncbi:hypothetical protein NBH19_16750 [Rhizobium sp. S95]|uniref:Uncharacterized protein n=1 Tax=Ciceribacter sichuanensis TaxID=2949647 RepID=A0AAJ1BV14_9HYPH|nr:MULTISPECIES: hypothetical protein [unclassified Ciceribacter]MCM2397723.1 hypothetical protein [Ciceribacter sp. S95]MCM2399584.1 hypothetical protein [Ciceribacter sp. S153]MCO5956372.1 hypothetical protein [Ciceribacter sp. S101]